MTAVQRRPPRGYAALAARPAARQLLVSVADLDGAVLGVVTVTVDPGLGDEDAARQAITVAAAGIREVRAK